MENKPSSWFDIIFKISKPNWIEFAKEVMDAKHQETRSNFNLEIPGIMITIQDLQHDLSANITMSSKNQMKMGLLNAEVQTLRADMDQLQM